MIVSWPVEATNITEIKALAAIEKRTTQLAWEKLPDRSDADPGVFCMNPNGFNDKFTDNTWFSIVWFFCINRCLTTVKGLLSGVTSWNTSRIVLLRHGQSEGNVDHLLYTSSSAILGWTLLYGFFVLFDCSDCFYDSVRNFYAIVSIDCSLCLFYGHNFCPVSMWAFRQGKGDSRLELTKKGIRQAGDALPNAYGTGTCSNTESRWPSPHFGFDPNSNPMIDVFPFLLGSLACDGFKGEGSWKAIEQHYTSRWVAWLGASSPSGQIVRVVLIVKKSLSGSGVLLF